MWVLKRIKFKETCTRTMKICQRLKNIIRAVTDSSSSWQYPWRKWNIRNWSKCT